MRRLILIAMAFVAVVTMPLIALPASAQDGVVQPVTDDAVNAIAAKLYCPVCENITLDTCGTAACADWRYEIRLQLESGMTEDDIVNDFVRRFGDRVVGTPIDPALRALSLYTPWIVIAGALIGGAVMLARRRTQIAPTPAASGTVDQYQAMFEEDIANS